MAQKTCPGCMYSCTEKKIRCICPWRPIFAYEPLSTLLFRQTRSTSPAYHDPQSTKPLGKLILICDGPENMSWMHVRSYRKKIRCICPWRPIFAYKPLSTPLLFRQIASFTSAPFTNPNTLFCTLCDRCGKSSCRFNLFGTLMRPLQRPVQT